jgi:hypothetical protein
MRPVEIGRRRALRRRSRQNKTGAELIVLNETRDQSRQEKRRDFVMRGCVSNIAVKSSWFEATPILAATLDRVDSASMRSGTWAKPKTSALR